MYYIRTVGPLIRTATWLEKLDGGLEYLKAVIIEDKGIFAKLLKPML